MKLLCLISMIFCCDKPCNDRNNSSNNISKPELGRNAAGGCLKFYLEEQQLWDMGLSIPQIDTLLEVRTMNPNDVCRIDRERKILRERKQVLFCMAHKQELFVWPINKSYLYGP